jgi:outer membrane protein OmpA-like peptidoglycan-associated protein/tetratricopeptide (TPR) repeat protein
MIMRTYLSAFVMVMFLYPSYIGAQINVVIRKKEFQNEKTGFEAAWKNVTRGDDYFAGKGIWYTSAYDEYRKAMAYNNSNPELNYKIGVAALFSDRKDEAASFLQRAYELKNDVAEDILFLLGRALHYSGRYTEAVEKFNEYIGSSVKKTDEAIALAEKYIEECNSALIITQDTARISISNMGSNVNSHADEYSELFSADEQTVFFASRRELFKKSNNYYPDSKFDENILISNQNDGVWEPAITAGEHLTTRYCESPLYLSRTGDQLYLYTGYLSNGDIRVTEKKKGEWKAPENIPYNINTSGSESSFTFAPSETEIFFVTNGIKKGFGGKDIYYIRKINDRKWSKPQNAGSAINTPFDEESIRFSIQGDTLWFSSKGHNSIGGFDIFYSVKDQSGEWSKAVNAGYPLNTVWDELFYYPSVVDDSAFYFVSNRSGGFGGLDIYRGRILPPPPEPVAMIEQLPPAKPDTVIIRDTVLILREIVPAAEPPEEPGLFLVGKVNDSETGESVMAKIDVIEVATNQTVATTASSDIDGTYRAELPSKQSYYIDFRSTGFLSDMKRINIPETYDLDTYNFDVTMVKAKVGKRVVLNNILFETGKSILTTGSFAELDRLLKILEDNPLMRIEISGHTDNTGSLALNMKLSEDRARAVVEYLVQKGIDNSRMEFKGFGPSQPIADNSTAAGRAVNRRVEFKILEF